MNKFWWMVLALAGGLTGIMAQPGKDPAALNSLRLRYQTLLQEAEAAPRARWLAALEGREKQCAATGDYEAAAMIRSRRLAHQSGKSEDSFRRAPVLKLNALTARSSTAVDFLDAGKIVARFRRTGSQMEWELPGQTPGTYQVNLVCGVTGSYDQSSLPDPLKDPSVPLPNRAPGTISDSTAGGVVEFRKITNLKEGGSVLRCSVRSTGGWAEERTINMGKIDLDGKLVAFNLRAVDVLPAGLMDFRRIELVPDIAPGGVPADPASIRELVRLQDVYQKQFREQTKAVTAKYLKALNELEVASMNSRDNDTLALVRQEKERVGQGDSGMATGPAGAGSRVLPVTERLYMLVKGEARLTSQGDYLTRMRPAGSCEVTWKLAGLGVTSGTYSVEVECRLTPEHGGTATLCATAPGGVAGPKTVFSVKPPEFSPAALVTKRKPDGTPGTSMTHTFDAGKVTIPRGSEYLKLQVTTLTLPDGALFDLKSLRLIPLESPPP